MKSTTSKEIWKQIRTGDRIEARTTIEIPDEDGNPRRSVTVGKQYLVTVYPEHSGLMVRITGDTGLPHEITGDYIENFKWIPRRPVEQEKNVPIQPHRRASDNYYNRVDAALKALDLAYVTHAESAIVDDWSCLDFPAEGCAQYIASQRMKPAST